MEIKKVVILVCIGLIGFSASAQEQGIIDYSGSPYVKFKGIDMGDCIWTDGFWAE